MYSCSMRRAIISREGGPCPWVQPQRRVMGELLCWLSQSCFCLWESVLFHKVRFPIVIPLARIQQMSCYLTFCKMSLPLYIFLPMYSNDVVAFFCRFGSVTPIYLILWMSLDHQSSLPMDFNPNGLPLYQMICSFVPQLLLSLARISNPSNFSVHSQWRLGGHVRHLN